MGTPCSTGIEPVINTVKCYTSGTTTLQPIASTLTPQPTVSTTDDGVANDGTNGVSNYANALLPYITLFSVHLFVL